MNRFLISVIAVFIGFQGLFSQESIEKIKRNQENTLKEIEYANKLLLETQGKTKESLNELILINHRLNKRKEYVFGIELEVNVLSAIIEENLNASSALQVEINKIKKVYGQLIYNLYKNRNSYYRMMYLLAAENMNQFYKRVRIIRIYNKYLRSRRDKLESLREELLKKNVELEELRNQKDALAKNVKRESSQIEREISAKKVLLNQLKKKQKDIENEIYEKERTARKLGNELRRIIEEERKKSKSSGSKELLTPEEKIISGDFQKNEGRLPWPTEMGVITGKYGEHQHPDYKSVTIRNDGVYISTTKGGFARSIFKGIVSRVFSIPGENYTVIIKHGDFYTLYHNLINVYVKAGQSVNTKENLGTVFTNENTRETILYFQIWKETDRMDPEIWLAH
jgi:murein hydrolase activator